MKERISHSIQSDTSEHPTIYTSPAVGRLVGSAIVDDMTRDPSRELTILSLNIVLTPKDVRPEFFEDNDISS